MSTSWTKKRSFLLGAALVLALGVSGCHRHKHAPPDYTKSQEPDKILYEKSLEDIQNKRYDVARLTLQTLINTYPNSDHLADAKLAVADSYYEQGGSGPLTHAEIEYKDFITFFPNHSRVAYAQYRAGMCEYRQLEKADRDPTHTRRAEREFQLLLLHHGTSEYAEEGERKLIQVQELLGEAEYRVSRFYYIKRNWRAAAARLVELVERYPNYSKRDHALWMLGKLFQKNVPVVWPADPERAAGYLARLIREHPLSDYVGEARDELRRLGQRIPEPDPVLLARQQNVTPIGEMEEVKRERGFFDRGLLGWMFGMVGGKPDTSKAAAYLGPPPLRHNEDIPEIPPPQFPIRPAQANASVQIAQNVSGQGEQSENEEKKEASNKKSFWRKLIPFY